MGSEDEGSSYLSGNKQFGIDLDSLTEIYLLCVWAGHGELRTEDVPRNAAYMHYERDPRCGSISKHYSAVQRRSCAGTKGSGHDVGERAEGCGPQCWLGFASCWIFREEIGNMSTFAQELLRYYLTVSIPCRHRHATVQSHRDSRSCWQNELDIWKCSCPLLTNITPTWSRLMSAKHILFYDDLNCNVPSALSPKPCIRITVALCWPSSGWIVIVFTPPADRSRGHNHFGYT
jgi:hypothetical protein